MPERDIIIIAGGGGMKKGAIPWLKRMAIERAYIREGGEKKNIYVFSLEEFILWANKTLT